MREGSSARELYQANCLVISLLGMSNVGKSMHSQMLRQEGFQVICVDSAIATVLSDHLGVGHASLSAVTAWMNHPDETEWKHRQRLYLRAETMVMELVVSLLEQPAPYNLVIDTTGSLPHTGAQIGFDLQNRSLMVYIRNDPARLAEDIRSFQEHPKPVIFGDDHYDRRPDESIDAARIRHFPGLLAWRSLGYAAPADITLERSQLSAHMRSEAFLNLLLCRSDALRLSSADSSSA